MNLRELLKDPHFLVSAALLAYLGFMAMGAILYRGLCMAEGRLI